MRHRILMVSDFLYPNLGGVENHIYQLAQCLLQRQHKVVIVTHAYGDRKGVRYLTNGLKVYYLPRLPFYLQTTLPTFLSSFRLCRCILLREQITLIHAHQAFSTMAHEAVLQGRALGYKVVFTDHSLFGFAEVGSILMNKVLKFTLSDVHHVICVSHTSKENTVLRACIPSHRVSVIPNAVNAAQFEPDLSRRPQDRIVVVALCRLVYRKGIDLLAILLPEVCRRHPHVDFLIGGDGPKRALLEQVIQEAGLQQRVRLVGAVEHEQARDILTQGHIFLNASLTEAFCMALIEAAATGLLVVSTHVGGVPEVLPSDMAILTEPSPKGLLQGLEQALVQLRQVDAWAFHQRIKSLYSWPRQAERTERVYDQVCAEAGTICSSADSEKAIDDGLTASLTRHFKCGLLFGKLTAAIALFLWLYGWVLRCVWPDETFDVCPDVCHVDGIDAQAVAAKSKTRQ